MAQRLAIESMQHGVTGAIGSGTRALHRRAFAKLSIMSAEGALINAAIFCARERHTVVLEFVNGIGRVAAEILDGILVAQPVGTFDGVVHVPAPVVRAHVRKRGSNAALGRNGVRARWKHLGDAGCLQARFRAAKGGAQARAASTHDDDIVGVVDEFICSTSVRGRAFSAVRFAVRGSGHFEH